MWLLRDVGLSCRENCLTFLYLHALKYLCPSSCQRTANPKSLAAWPASCRTSLSVFFSSIFSLPGWISNKVCFFLGGRVLPHLTSLPFLVEAASNPVPYPEVIHQFSLVCSNMTQCILLYPCSVNLHACAKCVFLAGSTLLDFTVQSNETLSTFS